MTTMPRFLQGTDAESEQQNIQILEEYTVDKKINRWSGIYEFLDVFNSYKNVRSNGNGRIIHHNERSVFLILKKLFITFDDFADTTEEKLRELTQELHKINYDRIQTLAIIKNNYTKELEKIQEKLDATEQEKQQYSIQINDIHKKISTTTEISEIQELHDEIQNHRYEIQELRDEIHAELSQIPTEEEMREWQNTAQQDLYSDVYELHQRLQKEIKQEFRGQIQELRGVVQILSVVLSIVILFLVVLVLKCPENK
jgi:predicted  nucleic acid-binding Zn-ribbon protein